MSGRGTRLLGAALGCLVLLAGLGVGTASAYTPRPGATFNRPTGTAAEKTAILDHINGTIRSARRGSTIRIATYSLKRDDVADNLIAAHRRGVDVRVVLNDNWSSREIHRLRRVLGRNPERRSFVVICHNSCRGRAGNQHSKFYLFSRTGKARHVVMTGSANLTGYGAYTQWNDLFTFVDRKAMHRTFARVFDEMVRDRPVRDSYLVKRVGAIESRFMPLTFTSPADDPVLRRLNRVRCKGAAPGTGVRGRTAIKVSMYGWVGVRGVYLAAELAELSRRGCSVRAIVSNTGDVVVATLKASGVEIRTPDRDRDGDGVVDLFNHQKFMLLSGRYKKSSSWHVWTGSENWSDRSLRNDEVTVHIPRRSAYRAYRRNFARTWAYDAYRR